MSISSAIDNNLAVLLLGFSMTGGLAYGGYWVFKDNPRPVTELLKTKQRVALDKDDDKKEWDANWAEYVKNHTTTKTIAPEEATPPKKPAKPKSNIQTEIAEKDLWNLDDWGAQQKNKIAPDSFKNKCEEIKNTKMLGTWTIDYENYEKYCTKKGESEEE